MLLKQLKYFVTIVDCNNFTEAAEKCYISQSAISQQIQSLEAELGYKLLIREKRSFTLTPAGKYLYSQIKRILDDIEKMKEKAKYIANTDNYSLKIGYLKSYNGEELQNAIIEFNKQFPEVNIEIIAGTHEELSDKVFNGELDMKFTDQRKAFSNEFINFPVYTQYFYIKVPIYSSLVKNDKITLSEIKNIPYILISSNEQKDIESKYYHDILGFNNNFIFAENMEKANLLVASNKGILPIESNKKKIRNEGLMVHIPLYNKEKQISRKYYAFWKKDNDNKTIESFANILREQF